MDEQCRTMFCTVAKVRRRQKFNSCFCFFCNIFSLAETAQLGKRHTEACMFDPRSKHSFLSSFSVDLFPLTKYSYQWQLRTNPLPETECVSRKLKTSMRLICVGSWIYEICSGCNSEQIHCQKQKRVSRRFKKIEDRNVSYVLVVEYMRLLRQAQYFPDASNWKFSADNLVVYIQLRGTPTSSNDHSSECFTCNPALFDVLLGISKWSNEGHKSSTSRMSHIFLKLQS